MGFIQLLLKKRFTFKQIALFALFIVTLRAFIEWLLLDTYLGLGIFYEYSRFYLEIVYYFVTIFFLLIFLISKIVRKNFADVANYGIKFFPIIIIPPLIDYFFFGRTGNYPYATIKNFFYNFLTVSLVRGDATPGMIFEILLALFFICAYVFYTRRSFILTILSWFVTLLVIVVTTTPDLFFGVGKGNAYTEHFIPSYYFFPSIILFALFLYDYKKEKLKAILSNLRPLRSGIFLIVVISGSLASLSFGYPLSFYKTFLAIVALLFVWQFSIVINDIYDYGIDNITNKNRPLVRKILTKEEYKFVAFIFAFFALSFSAILNLQIFLLTILGLVLGIIYSIPPIRLRNYILGNSVIGGSLVISFMIGWLVTDNYQLLFYDKNLIFFFLLFIFGTIITFTKDLKDIQSDSKFGVRNIFTILGKNRGKKAVIILLLIVLNLPPLLIKDFTLLPITIVFSFLTCFVYHKKEDEKLVYVMSALLVVYIFISLYWPSLSLFSLVTMNPKDLLLSEKRINDSINRAIDFLYYDQLDYGEFKTFAYQNGYTFFDSSPFTTTFVLYSLRGIEDERVEIIKSKAVKFFLEEQENGGLWRYWTSRNFIKKRENTLPDLDDISTVSFALKTLNVKFDDNKEVILNNRNHNNLFLTWLFDNNTDKMFHQILNSTEVDCAVNANVLLYLNKSEVSGTVCRFINEQIANDSCYSLWYKKKSVLYYFVARAYENGINCLNKSRDKIVKDTLEDIQNSIQNGDYFDLALNLNTLFIYGYNGDEIEVGLKYLLENQNIDGSWNPDVFFGDRINPYDYANSKVYYYVYSKDLTTALAIEALARYKQNLKYQVK